MTPEEFRAEMKRLGIRQVTFAWMTGMAPTTVSRWAKGIQPVPKWVDLVLELWAMDDVNRARLAAFGIPPVDRRETHHRADGIRRRSDAP